MTPFLSDGGGDNLGLRLSTATAVRRPTVRQLRSARCRPVLHELHALGETQGCPRMGRRRCLRTDAARSGGGPRSCGDDRGWVGSSETSSRVRQGMAKHSLHTRCTTTSKRGSFTTPCWSESRRLTSGVGQNMPPTWKTSQSPRSNDFGGTLPTSVMPMPTRVA
jgi:hypothetical protein